VTERRQMSDPRLQIVSAAPLAGFALPFEAAAARGLGLLFGVAVITIVLTALLTRRMTRSLHRLAVAADDVGSGNLAARVDADPRDEVGRVAAAFNSMAGSLSDMLAERSHREALAAVGSFASELAHEVRNPLTSIKVDLQYVEERLNGSDELRTIQRGVIEEIGRLDRTVAGVLQIARSGRIALLPLDAREPLRAAVRLADPVATAKGAGLVLDLPGTPLAARGDAVALQQLLTNLLLNAIQAVSTGGRIVARAYRSPDRILFEIADDGVGIPPDRLERIHEPFYTTRAEGTGLGLAIASRIAAAHNGSLEITSVEGTGTVARVLLPRA
jgi:two-component system, NtrC family, sensor histidine kinase HydH